MQKSLVLAAFFLCASASAQVYKCPAPGGKIVYSDVPCTGGVNTGIQNVPSEARPYDPANDPNARAAAILQGDREAKDAARNREAMAAAKAQEEKRTRAIQEATLREIRRGNQINEANARKLDDAAWDNRRKTTRCRPSGMGDLICD